MKSEELARRLKIVEERLSALERHLEISRDVDLEVELAEKLKVVRVVVSRNPDLGPVAAQIFEHYVRPAEAERLAREDRRLGIGISGGRAIRSMVSCINQEYENLDVYPLSCPGLPEDVAFSVNTAIALFCMKYERKDVVGRPLPVDPEYFDRISAKDQKQINDSMLTDLESNIHYVFTGIGSLGENAALPKLARRFDIDLEPFKNEGLVGDMLYRGINRQGESVRIPGLDERIVGVRPDQLSRIRDAAPQIMNGEHKFPLSLVVGIAGGREKAEAIYAACQAKYINVLVTDEDTASELIKESAKSRAFGGY